MLNWLLLEVVKIEFAFTFPPLNVLIALVGTVVLALLLMRIHSGVRFATSRGRPSAMHEPAIGLPRVLRGARLPLTRHVESAGLDVLLFSGATAIVAVHAIVDSFVAPEPGTGPEDHLLRGSVSLAILALAAVAYPRLRGARAALAAALGALALEAALAIADARAVGARGEDWTDFLLLPVGLVLLALAVVLLWRSRKPGRFRTSAVARSSSRPSLRHTSSSRRSRSGSSRPTVPAAVAR